MKLSFSGRSGLASFLLLSFVKVVACASNECILEDSESGTCTLQTVELNTMLRWSSLVYTFATLRDIVRDYEGTYNDDKKGTVRFQNPEFIHTQNSAAKTPFEGTFLKYPISAKDISQFMKLNNKYLVGDDGTLEYNPDGNRTLDLPSMRHLSFVDDEFDADIVEFDDEFVDNGFFGLSAELVFSVIVNRTEKRITVVFRGSANTKDFIVDAGIIKKTPSELSEFAGKKIGVHGGIAGYLFGRTAEGEDMSKFDQIMKILKQLYAVKEYADYELYITGHSLGGGLTQLLAFTLAGSKEADFVPKPIYAISYASPCVGNYHYYKQFQRLEKEGKLRHIRVSNQGDIVAVVPSVGFHQTGINLHAQVGKKMEIKYHDNKKSLYSQFNFDFVSKHGLTSYAERMFTEENVDILTLDIEGLYAKYADF